MDGITARVEADGVGRIEVCGYLNDRLSDRIAAAAVELLGEGCRAVVVDLSGVELMNCCGLRALVSLAGRARAAGGRLVLTGARPTQRRILRRVCRGLQIGVSAEPPRLSAEAG